MGAGRIPNDTVAEALRQAHEHLRSGRDDEALACCERALRGDPGSGPARHAMGVALTRLDRLAEAVECLGQAIRLAPGKAPPRVALGCALRRQGRLGEARQALTEALGLEPGNAAAAFNLALVLADRGEHLEAARALRAVTRANPADFDAHQLLVDQVAAAVRAGAVPVPAAGAPPVDLGRVTIGLCSIDRRREAAAVASLDEALQPSKCDFAVVRDARSLAEGFNRILDAAKGDVVILCHDDIEVLSGNATQALHQALAAHDIVGVAGGRHVGGPAVLWSGHPHIHGWVSYPREGAIEAAPLSLRAGLLGGMQALDGVFMAMRGELARRHRFDAGTFDGFHFYDLDFTYRAYRDGARLAVTTDILLLHVSEGRFGDEWKRYALRFREKYPALEAPRGAAHWYGARLETREQLLRFYDELRRCAA